MFISTRRSQNEDLERGVSELLRTAKGFAFKKGRFDAIEVERAKVANPAADGSAYSHKLIRVIMEAKKEKDL